jgi:hypothetical protein
MRKLKFNAQQEADETYAHACVQLDKAQELIASKQEGYKERVTACFQIVQQALKVVDNKLRKDLEIRLGAKFSRYAMGIIRTAEANIASSEHMEDVLYLLSDPLLDTREKVRVQELLKNMISASEALNTHEKIMPAEAPVGLPDSATATQTNGGKSSTEAKMSDVPSANVNTCVMQKKPTKKRMPNPKTFGDKIYKCVLMNLHESQFEVPVQMHSVCNSISKKTLEKDAVDVLRSFYTDAQKEGLDLHIIKIVAYVFFQQNVICEESYEKFCTFVDREYKLRK